MTLRLLRILVRADLHGRADAILVEHEAEPRWCLPLQDDRVMIEVILPAEGNEPILNELEDAFRDTEGFRLVFFPVQATVPRLGWGEEEERERKEKEREAERERDAAEEGEEAEADEEPRKAPARINREELYASLDDASKPGTYYLGMVALSSIVASAGLLLGDGAVIIGAMVIAPLIGPSIAVALATTLGDLRLGRRALFASLAGMCTAFAVALAAGVLVTVDPTGAEIESRTRLTFEHLALALAAGAAGAIATSRGVGTGLVGVMVAVALLPPLANGGLLLGDGHTQAGIGALILVLGNVVCVNLTATATFLVQGVRPNNWWEEDVRRQAVWTASLLWGLLLGALVAIVWIGLLD